MDKTFFLIKIYFQSFFPLVVQRKDHPLGNVGGMIADALQIFAHHQQIHGLFPIGRIPDSSG